MINKTTIPIISFFIGLILSTQIRAQFQYHNLAITNVKIYPAPDVQPILKGTILIANGEITGVGNSSEVIVPDNFRIINCEGMVATSGYWNSHVHLIESKWQGADTIEKHRLEYELKKMLTSHGFVYAFDLAQLDFENLNKLRARIASNEVQGPHILAVGVPFTTHSPYYIKPATLPELTNRSEVELHILEQFKNGADGIKIWSASPTGDSITYMDHEFIKKAAELCKSYQKPLFAHPSNNLGVRTAIENGVTILSHVSPDDRVAWDTVLLHQMIERNIALIPTLKLYKWELEREGIPMKKNILLATALSQVDQFNKAGGTILFGTDVGYMKDYNPLDEFLMMEKAGMRFFSILASLTTNPAARFGYHNNTGKIAAGMKADIVILLKDPYIDIKNFTEVKYVFKNGECIYE